MKKIIGIFLLPFVWVSFASAAATGQSGNAYQSYLKALLLESQGNFVSAREELEKAIKISPENAFLYRTSAELSLRLGQVERASEEIERAIELNPKDVKGLIIAGQIQWALGNTDKAEERLKRALVLDPDESEALVSLAGALTPKKPSNAIKLYKDYLVRHPNEVEIMERLAQVYQSLGDFKNARKTWEEVLTVSPGSLRAHLALAQIAEIHFDTATAVAHYEGVLSQDPTNLPLLLRVGELRYRNNDMAKANEAFTKAQAIAPTSPSANFWLALLAENQGNWKEAIRLLKNVPEAHREAGVLLRLSYYYSQDGNYTEAVKILKKLSDSDPSNTDFLNYLAVAYEQNNQVANAEKTFKKMIDIDPNDAETHFHLATLYDRSGRFVNAESELRTAIHLKPDYHMALNYLGYSFADRNIHLDEAEQLVNDAIARDPDNPAYLDSMGWVYFRQGKLDKAKDFLREASTRANDSVIWDHYGDILTASGEPIQAILAWDEALRVDPTFKAVRAKLDKAMKRIGKNEKIGLFVKRAITSFGDIESIHGLVHIKVCQSKPCFESNANFEYERGNELKVEIPGPFAGPILLLTKKHGQPAKYGALHPQFQTAEFYVTRAFDRIDPLLSAEGFKEVDLAELGMKSEEKGGKLFTTAGIFQIVFDDTTGAVKSLGWDDEPAPETLIVGAYNALESGSLPKFLEWRDQQSKFSMRIDFLSPVVATANSIPPANRKP